MRRWRFADLVARRSRPKRPATARPGCDMSHPSSKRPGARRTRSVPPNIFAGRAQGTVEVRPAPGHNHLLVSILASNVASLGGVVARVRRSFDLDADIAAIDRHLSTHPPALAESLQAFSAAMVADPKLLRAYETLTETIAKLRALPGIEPWTAQYISMRALREPDAFPATDRALLRLTTTHGARRSPRELLKRGSHGTPMRSCACGFRKPPFRTVRRATLTGPFF